MRIGLNATCLNDRPSGAKQRFEGIYRELVKQMPDDEFIVFEPEDCRVGAWFEGAPNVSVRTTPLPSEGRRGRFLAGMGYWRSALEKESLDLFECFNLPQVIAPTGRNLMTIHDVRGLRSGSAGRIERLLFNHVLQSAVSRADQLITVSEAVRQELLETWPKANVSVVYNGLDLAKFGPVEVDLLERTRHSLALPKRYLLAVGHFEPRKNYLGLIEALAILRRRGSQYSLVIIGNDSGGKAPVQERVRHHGLENSVTLLSGLSDFEVRCAYQACHAFVFPSTYEGFGIPILEAMAAERPMVLSGLPVFREITQSQGLYFDADDVEALADAIETVSTSPEIRVQLVDYGKRRVGDFSFSSLATKMREVYHVSINGSKRETHLTESDKNE